MPNPLFNSPHTLQSSKPLAREALKLRNQNKQRTKQRARWRRSGKRKQAYKKKPQRMKLEGQVRSGEEGKPLWPPHQALNLAKYTRNLRQYTNSKAKTQVRWGGPSGHLSMTWTSAIVQEEIRWHNLPAPNQGGQVGPIWATKASGAKPPWTQGNFGLDGSHPISNQDFVVVCFLDSVGNRWNICLSKFLGQSDLAMRCSGLYNLLHK